MTVKNFTSSPNNNTILTLPFILVFILVFFVLLFSSTALAQQEAAKKEKTENTEKKNQPETSAPAPAPAPAPEKNINKQNQQSNNETAPAENSSAQDPKTEKSNSTDNSVDNSINNEKINNLIPLEQQTSDLTHYIDKNKLKPILVGTNTYHMVEHESFEPNIKGTAILLPDWHQHAMSPKAINFLQTELASFGWNTWTIQPPSIPSNYPSTSDKASAKQQENQEVLKEYNTTLTGIISAVMEKAQSQPGIFIVFAQGSHGAMLVNLYQSMPDLKPEALILLSSFMPSQVEDDLFAQQLAENDIPTLDLTLRRDHRNATLSAKKRKQHAKKAMKISYRQKQLFNINSSYYPEQPLIKEINGWLKSIGW